MAKLCSGIPTILLRSPASELTPLSSPPLHHGSAPSARLGEMGTRVGGAHPRQWTAPCLLASETQRWTEKIWYEMETLKPM